MKIAAISDVHGNLLALEAVLADAAEQSADLVVNLGDLLSGGLQPAETAERLMALDLHTVRGNHERQVLTTPVADMSASDLLAHESITAAHRAWMASLPLTLQVADGVLAFHGCPTDDATYLLDSVEETGARPATEREVIDRLGEHATSGEWSLLLCGHTHIQRQMLLPSGALVVNPGSVGLPAYDDDNLYPHVMQAGSPHARYALLDDAHGNWQVTFRAVDYNWEHAATTAETNDRPDVARALRTGLV